MLCTCLFFDRNTLANDYSTVREIADRLFPNNFIINIYNSTNLNLVRICFSVFFINHFHFS